MEDSQPRKALRLHVKGNLAEMDARAVARALTDTLNLLKAIQGTEDIYTIDHLQESSTIVDIGAPAGIVDIVERGMVSLENEPIIPSGWNSDAIEALTRIYKSSSGAGIAGISLGTPLAPIAITLHMVTNSTEALAKQPQSLGSVTGRLYRYSHRRGALRAGIEDLRTGRTVSVEVDQANAGVLIEHLEEVVTIWGTLKRDPGTNEIQHVKLNGIRVAPVSSVSPPAATHRGILGSDWMRRRSAVELVREQRRA